jgi:hypothetical protein
MVCFGYLLSVAIHLVTLFLQFGFKIIGEISVKKTHFPANES